MATLIENNGRAPRQSDIEALDSRTVQWALILAVSAVGITIGILLIYTFRMRGMSALAARSSEVIERYISGCTRIAAQLTTVASSLERAAAELRGELARDSAAATALRTGSHESSDAVWRGRYYAVPKVSLPQPTPSTSSTILPSPLVLIVNKRSGGGLGATVMETAEHLRAELGWSGGQAPTPPLRVPNASDRAICALRGVSAPVAVFTLSVTGLHDALACLQRLHANAEAEAGSRSGGTLFGAPRLVCAGGDGTVSAVIQFMQEQAGAMETDVPEAEQADSGERSGRFNPRKVALAVIPLGTGNDIARSLGYGGQPPSIDSASLGAWFARAAMARTVPVDVWSVSFMTHPRGSIRVLRGGVETLIPEKEVRGSSVLYTSLGPDAELVWAVEMRRSAHAWVNKVLYALWGGVLGARNALSRRHAGLLSRTLNASRAWYNTDVAGPLPPSSYTLPALPPGTQTLIAVSSPSYASGTNIWPAAWSPIPGCTLGGWLGCLRPSGQAQGGPASSAGDVRVVGEEGFSGSGWGQGTMWRPQSMADGRVEIVTASSLVALGAAVSSKTGFLGGISRLGQVTAFELHFLPVMGNESHHTGAVRAQGAKGQRRLCSERIGDAASHTSRALTAARVGFKRGIKSLGGTLKSRLLRRRPRPVILAEPEVLEAGVGMVEGTALACVRPEDSACAPEREGAGRSMSHVDVEGDGQRPAQAWDAPSLDGTRAHLYPLPRLTRVTPVARGYATLHRGAMPATGHHALPFTRTTSPATVPLSASSVLVQGDGEGRVLRTGVGLGVGAAVYEAPSSSYEQSSQARVVTALSISTSGSGPITPLSIGAALMVRPEQVGSPSAHPALRRTGLTQRGVAHAHAATGAGADMNWDAPMDILPGVGSSTRALSGNNPNLFTGTSHTPNELGTRLDFGQEYQEQVQVNAQAEAQGLHTGATLRMPPHSPADIFTPLNGNPVPPPPIFVQVDGEAYCVHELSCLAVSHAGQARMVVGPAFPTAMHWPWQTRVWAAGTVHILRAAAALLRGAAALGTCSLSLPLHVRTVNGPGSGSVGAGAAVKYSHQHAGMAV